MTIPSLLKLAVFFSVAICKQLNAVLYLCGVYEPSDPHYHGKRPRQLCLRINTRLPMCASLTPRPMDVIVGLRTRLSVRMCMVSYTMDSYSTKVHFEALI